jgi:epsilon-lactone hydrolase
VPARGFEVTRTIKVEIMQHRCISPWVDMEARGASYASNAAIDPMISREYILELAGWYLAGASPRAPLAAPVHADLAGLPPLLVQVGSAETPLDDSIQITARAAAANVRVTLGVWPHMIHAWPMFHQQLTDGRRAIAAAGFVHPGGDSLTAQPHPSSALRYPLHQIGEGIRLVSSARRQAPAAQRE